MPQKRPSPQLAQSGCEVSCENSAAEKLRVGHNERAVRGLLTAPLSPVLSRRLLRALWCALATTSSYVTTCHKGPFDTRFRSKVPCHGDRAAPCHQGPLHTLPFALGPPPAHPKWPRLEGIPGPKVSKTARQNLWNSSKHQQMLPFSVGSGHLRSLTSGNLYFPLLNSSSSKICKLLKIIVMAREWEWFGSLFPS